MRGPTLMDGYHGLPEATRERWSTAGCTRATSAGRRRRLRLPRGPHEGPHRPRRVQRLPGRDRGGPARPARRARGGRRRRPPPGARRGGLRRRRAASRSDRGPGELEAHCAERLADFKRPRRYASSTHSRATPWARSSSASCARSSPATRSHDDGRRVALVTGGGRGIGAAVVRALAADGAAVAFCARDADSVGALQREIKAGGGEALGVVADMADAAAVAAFVAAAADRLGPVDMLVNNVGQSPSRNFQRMTDADWLGLLELNLLAAVRCTRAVLPGMRERGLGPRRHGRVALREAPRRRADRLRGREGRARRDRQGARTALRARRGPGQLGAAGPHPHADVGPRRRGDRGRARGRRKDVLASMAAAVPVGRYGEAARWPPSCGSSSRTPRPTSTVPRSTSTAG